MFENVGKGGQTALPLSSPPGTIIPLNGSGQIVRALWPTTGSQLLPRQAEGGSTHPEGPAGGPEDWMQL